MDSNDPASNASPKSKKPESLGIKCTDSACEDNLHCFKRARSTKAKPAKPDGTCRSCGANLIDWPRVQQCDVTDVEHTFEQLRHELIRHHFWHVPFDQKAINHAIRKGRINLYEAAHQRIATSVGRSRDDNPRDGRQTGFTDNTLFYAQHATASCCRTCIEYWHGIPADRGLADGEVEYLTELVTRYLDERLPELADGPGKVPPVRRS